MLVPISLPAGTTGKPVPVDSLSFGICNPDSGTAYIANYRCTITPVNITA